MTGPIQFQADGVGQCRDEFGVVEAHVLGVAPETQQLGADRLGVGKNKHQDTPWPEPVGESLEQNLQPVERQMFHEVGAVDAVELPGIARQELQHIVGDDIQAHSPPVFRNPRVALDAEPGYAVFAQAIEKDSGTTAQVEHCSTPGKMHDVRCLHGSQQWMVPLAELVGGVVEAIAGRRSVLHGAGDEVHRRPDTANRDSPPLPGPAMFSPRKVDDPVAARDSILEPAEGRGIVGGWVLVRFIEQQHRRHIHQAGHAWKVACAPGQPDDNSEARPDRQQRVGKNPVERLLSEGGR